MSWLVKEKRHVDVTRRLCESQGRISWLMAYGKALPLDLCTCTLKPNLTSGVIGRAPVAFTCTASLKLSEEQSLIIRTVVDRLLGSRRLLNWCQRSPLLQN